MLWYGLIYNSVHFGTGRYASVRDVRPLYGACTNLTLTFVLVSSWYGRVHPVPGSTIDHGMMVVVWVQYRDGRPCKQCSNNTGKIIVIIFKTHFF